MKPKRYLRLIGVLSGGALCLCAFVIANEQFGTVASASDMEVAAVLGAALGWALILIFANKSRKHG
jgi:ABC-type Fe3+-siderophore transport system permease subunit